MTFELILFIVVAAVAIFSAAFMLVSRNAVHSALFLVVNLLCVAFFYLMLSAPFLAMVQITVYAGAIMVLFMFVIMLLGSERLGGGTAKYSWLAGGAVTLSTIFLVVVFLAVAQGQLGTLAPQPQPPQARFIHAVANAPAVDIYLNEQRVAADLSYGDATPVQTLRAGDYNSADLRGVR
jgi:NADH-quinone oxidoreductase subunit J